MMNLPEVKPTEPGGRCWSAHPQGEMDQPATDVTITGWSGRSTGRVGKPRPIVGKATSMLKRLLKLGLVTHNHQPDHFVHVVHLCHEY